MMTQNRLLEKEGVRAILVDVKKCGPIPFFLCHPEGSHLFLDEGSQRETNDGANGSITVKNNEPLLLRLPFHHEEEE